MENNIFVNLNKLEKETIRRYDEITEEYNRDWRGKHDKVQIKALEKFIRMIGPPPKKILDAGCGTGKDCIYFASHGYEVYGIDLSRGMLEKAKKNSENKNLKINFSIGNMKSLVFPNSYFDGVWTMAAIVHLSPKEKQKAIREFYRVLKPKGILRISTQSLLSLKHLIRLLQSYLSYLRFSNANLVTKFKSSKERIKMGYAYLDNRHWFYPTRHSLLQILKEEGLFILETNHLFSRRLSIYAQKKE